MTEAKGVTEPYGEPMESGEALQVAAGLCFEIADLVSHPSNANPDYREGIRLSRAGRALIALRASVRG
jgi:hypothetical protein